MKRVGELEANRIKGFKKYLVRFVTLIDRSQVGWLSLNLPKASWHLSSKRQENLLLKLKIFLKIERLSEKTEGKVFLLLSENSSYSKSSPLIFTSLPPSKHRIRARILVFVCALLKALLCKLHGAQYPPIPESLHLKCHRQQGLSRHNDSI